MLQALRRFAVLALLAGVVGFLVSARRRPGFLEPNLPARPVRIKGRVVECDQPRPEPPNGAVPETPDPALSFAFSPIVERSRQGDTACLDLVAISESAPLTAPIPSGGKRLWKLGLTAVACLVFSGVVSVGTLAVFSDQASVNNNSFTSGTIDISVAPASAAITMSNMLPGDAVTDDVVVTNGASSSQGRYALSASATNADGKNLKDQLTLVVKTIDVTSPGTPCDNFDGTQLYTGDLDGTAGVIFGSSAQGAQAGDRTLNGNSNETLCFRVALPSATPNSYQGAASTATLTFDAEQTANNP